MAVTTPQKSRATTTSAKALQANASAIKPATKPPIKRSSPLSSPKVALTKPKPKTVTLSAATLLALAPMREIIAQASIPQVQSLAGLYTALDILSRDLTAVAKQGMEPTPNAHDLAPQLLRTASRFAGDAGQRQIVFQTAQGFLDVLTVGEPNLPNTRQQIRALHQAITKRLQPPATTTISEVASAGDPVPNAESV